MTEGSRDSYERFPEGLRVEMLAWSADARVSRLSPKGDTAARPTVVFVPGYLSQPYTWRLVLPALTSHFDLLYVETAEKLAGHRTKESYSPRRMSSVLSYIMARANDGFGSVGVIGASTGANLLIEAFRTPRAGELPWLALLLPHERVPIPRWATAFKPVPGLLLDRLQPGLVRFKRRRLMRPIANTAQARGELRAIEATSPWVVRESALSWRRYVLDPSTLRPTGQRIMIIGASEDPMHEWSASVRIARNLGAELVDVVSFTRAHQARTASMIIDWAAGLTAMEREESSNG